ncbi:MAG: DUF424 family protein [Nanoarchaeota archaeon]|nr:DUF424 family protein [Nanoarchaeota archaeon]MBU0962789.1 DUF424 family protein [Nanoarchaeota archaeon]
MSKKKSEFYVKIHKRDRILIAACDSELIEKTLEEGDLQLKVSKSFYKGDLMDEDSVLNILKEAKNFNIVGNNIVNLMIENKIINKEHILYINKVAHAQVFEI